MLYHLFEISHAAVAPLRFMAETAKAVLDHEHNPWGDTPGGKAMSALLEVVERTTRRYPKPAFGLDTTMINGQPVPVTQEIVHALPFCDLIHFRRDLRAFPRRRPDPRVLIVAPLSGHYATLLRGTVAAMLPEHEVYITDWVDARLVPADAGKFDLEDYTRYLIEFLRVLGPGSHAMGVCQPGVPLLMATAVMAQDQDPSRPASITIMGSPIDTRRSPTMPNRLAEQKPLAWFEDNVITTVPWPNAGAGRRVYPGFLQLTGFVTMNLERHMDAHHTLYRDLVAGDGDGAEAHRTFYDEYLAVLDLTAEFYLQTVSEVFQKHALPKGEMMFEGRRVDPAAITDTALMTVEGEKDDISGIGQTQAAHDLCPNIPPTMKVDYIQPGVGHYGVFNGARWRTEIQPRVRDFIRSNMGKRG